MFQISGLKFPWIGISTVRNLVSFWAGRNRSERLVALSSELSMLGFLLSLSVSRLKRSNKGTPQKEV